MSTRDGRAHQRDASASVHDQPFRVEVPFVVRPGLSWKHWGRGDPPGGAVEFRLLGPFTSRPCAASSARAFLRDERDLMILDEPSAGLDAEAEHGIHTRLREIRSGRTSLLISHRLGAVRDADLIVVLAGGVVSEQGGHTELLAAGGVYARLFTSQAAGYRGAPVSTGDRS